MNCEKHLVLVLCCALYLSTSVFGSALTSSKPKIDIPGPVSPYTARRWDWTNSVGEDGLASGRPLVIAHRGASGMYPEHTKLAYEKAAEQNADIIECDVTITKDLHLICAHEPWIGELTNVASDDVGPPHPNFDHLYATYDMSDDDGGYDWNDKGNISNYFAYDFTLEELQTLRRKQALDYRDHSFDWQETFITFHEYLQMANDLGFGIYPEIKHGAVTNKLLRSRGVSETFESLILRDLNSFGFSGENDACFVQSYERTSLKAVREKSGSKLRLIMLLNKDNRTTDEDLDEYQQMGVYGIGLTKDALVMLKGDRHILKLNRELVDRIHDRGFQLHVYTFRNEYPYLNFDYGQDPYVEYETLLNLGVDGYFTDFPASLIKYFRYKMLEAESGGSASGWQGAHINTLTAMLIAIVVSTFGRKIFIV